VNRVFLTLIEFIRVQTLCGNAWRNDVGTWTDVAHHHGAGLLGATGLVFLSLVFFFHFSFSFLLVTWIDVLFVGLIYDLVFLPWCS
jgi:hypothetical protein